MFHFLQLYRLHFKVTLQKSLLKVITKVWCYESLLCSIISHKKIMRSMFIISQVLKTINSLYRRQAWKIIKEMFKTERYLKTEIYYL